VIPVSLLDGRSRRQIDAERGARQGKLDVVNSEGVAGEDRVDVSAANQLREVLHATRVYDDWPGDDGNSAAAFLYFLHHRRDSRHASLHAAFRRDVVAHERKAEAIAFPEFRRHTNPFVSADDRVADCDVTQLAADGPTVLVHDDGIHPLLFNFPPPASDPYVGAMVRRRVEVVGDTTVLLGGLEERVALPDGMAPPCRQLLEQFVELLRIGRTDAHLDAGRVVIGPSNVELEDFVLSAVFDDFVEDCR
jgi:hypothetical protein